MSADIYSLLPKICFIAKNMLDLFAKSYIWSSKNCIFGKFLCLGEQASRVRTLNLLDTCGVEMDSMYWIHAVWKWIDFFMI